MDRTRLSELGTDAVVVGVDGSEHATTALDHAAERAARQGRRLVVAVARDWPQPAASGVSAAVVATEAADRARAAHPDLDVATVVEDGDPRTLLLDLATRARLLVLGSRGRGPLRTLLLGSVGATVARLAPCPMHVCRPRRADAPAPGGVLVAADGTPDSLPVLAHAFAEADASGVALHVVHYAFDAAAAAAVLRDGTSGALAADDAEEVRLGLAESIAGLREQHPDVEVSIAAEHGLVDRALADASPDWSLVVVGRHPLDSVRRLVVGSIATAVLERAHGTVAVVPVD